MTYVSGETYEVMVPSLATVYSTAPARMSMRIHFHDEQWSPGQEFPVRNFFMMFVHCHFGMPIAIPQNSCFHRNKDGFLKDAFINQIRASLRNSNAANKF